MGWLGHALVLASIGPAAAADAPPRSNASSEAAELREHREPPPPVLLPELRRRSTRREELPGGGERNDVLGDRTAGRIQVRVRPDGTVEVDVPRAFQARGAICLLGGCIGTRGLKRASKKPIQFATAPVIFGISGTFGWLPPSPRDATRFLTITRDQRIRQGIAVQRQRLARAGGQLSVQLGALLHDETLGDARRRAIVFELWDDAACAAVPTPSDEPLADERAAAATEARARIESFVRRWMPHGSSLGYTEEELAQLNAKRCSPEPFAPYAARVGDAR